MQLYYFHSYKEKRSSFVGYVPICFYFHIKGIILPVQQKTCNFSVTLKTFVFKQCLLSANSYADVYAEFLPSFVSSLSGNITFVLLCRRKFTLFRFLCTIRMVLHLIKISQSLSIYRFHIWLRGVHTFSLCVFVLWITRMTFEKLQ